MTVWTAIKETLIQTYWLSLKNFRLLVRNWRSTIAELLVPVLFIGLLAIIQPYAEPRCYSLLFAPNDDPLTNEIMSAAYLLHKQNDVLASQNKLQIYNETDILEAPNNAIVSFSDESGIFNFSIDHPNVTQAAVVFVRNCSAAHPSYTLWYNATCPFSIALGVECTDFRPQIQVAVDLAIVTLMAGTLSSSPPSLNLTLGEYPIVNQASDAVRTYGVVFFYCGIAFFSVVLLYKLAYEKEHKLRQGMRMVGLRGVAYWSSFFIVHSLLLNLLTALVLIASGYACRFPFFADTNFGVLFLLFFLSALSLSQLAFFVSTFIRTTKTAVAVGMLLFIVGLLFVLVGGVFGNLLFPALYNGSAGSTAVRWILYFLPMFHFAKAVTDVNSQSYTVGPLRGPGYSWHDLFVPFRLNDGPAEPTVNSFYWEMGLAALFSILAWYFDHVIPSDGSPQPLWFFLTPTYWGLAKPKAERSRHYEGVDDEDLREEYENATRSVNAQLRLISLKKVYRANPLFASSQDVVALQGLSFAVDEGSIFCLLGQNGAGKSTAINILTGLFAPTSGDAVVYGKSVVSEASTVRRDLGVCPQHDILWDELSAYEHLEIFAVLKRVRAERRHAAVMESLESVRLVRVCNQPVGTFSGGMKRRLSVAIATIGNPRIVCFDEPTTGMDPLSRRHIWNLIQRAKQGRVILLTTHSMEEAEVLADRVGIMVKGQLQAVGNVLHLKQRFGAGYHITVVAADRALAPKVKQTVAQLLPATLVAETGEYLHFSLSASHINAIVPFLRALEQAAARHDSPIRDWGVSHTTLEEVFLRVNRGELPPPVPE